MKHLKLALITSTALTGTAFGQTGDLEIDCSLVGGALPEQCIQDNATEVVVVDAGENNELDRGATATGAEGFLISIDGDTVVGDKRVEDLVRQTDIALSEADIQVKFDGLGAKPRLDLVPEAATSFEPGDQIVFRSRTNYPAYLARGEIRVMDLGNRAGPKLLQTVPIRPNGAATVVIPEGENVVVIHRVYDAKGRYDETEPLGLDRRDDRGLVAEVEEGTDATRIRRIPVSGGAITVFGSGVAPGARVQTLGETITPDPSGKFVIQRIMPAGDQAVDVSIRGAGRPVDLTRVVTIPKSEWFTVATADLTFGWRSGGGKDFAGGPVDRFYDRGRLAFYTKGKTQNGWEITASADTGEDELSEIFRNLDQKDPRHLLLRLDSDKAYPVYGDDSTLEEDAPTSGKFYFKAERDNNFALWGNYKGRISGSEYLRNERTLYGAQGHFQSDETTSKGEPRFEFDVYAAQPDTLPGRDVFRGTGGSIYFLQRQDLSIGSETIAIETRDATTGRVINREVLVYGRDYDINYYQGVVTLTRPLTGAVGGGTVVTDPVGENTVQLTVNYEFTPAVGTIDGYAYGGRAQVWATDQLRLGVTALVEQTDLADQTAYGADLRYELSDTTFVDLEYARTEGPGFGASFSSDGGLIVTNTAGVGGTGEAFLARGQLDLKDINPDLNGTLGAYVEKRRAGFSTLDYQTSVDEDLWGIYAEFAPTEQLTYRLYYDSFSDAAGKVDREGGVELTYKATERLTYDLGIEQIEKRNPAATSTDETGRRTDVAIRATVKESERLTWSVFGQATVARSGGIARNHRVGAGVKYRWNDRWSVEAEVSDGTRGVGALALLTYEDNETGSAYFGYTLDPGRTFSGVTLSGRDRGQFVMGGTRRLSQSVNVFAENTYDLFGTHRSLTSSYGVDYDRTDALRYSVSVELGRIDDPAGDFDRTALSFGVRYDTEQTTGSARLELRRDQGVISGTQRDGDTIAIASTVRHKIDDERRLLFSFEGSYTETDATVSTIPDGRYAEVSLGYAYRPINNDKLNLLFKYTYLHDLYGQEIDGTNDPGPRQKSHVLSLDGSYDLNRNWTVGGKIGGRWSTSSPDATTAFQDNDAWLVVANARYHLTHKWDVLVEGRVLAAEQAGTTEYGLLGAAYRHIGNNYKIGVGYNFGKFSDDLTDLTFDDRGLFVNLIAKF